MREWLWAVGPGAHGCCWVKEPGARLHARLGMSHACVGAEVRSLLCVAPPGRSLAQRVQRMSLFVAHANPCRTACCLPLFATAVRRSAAEEFDAILTAAGDAVPNSGGLLPDGPPPAPLHVDVRAATFTLVGMSGAKYSWNSLRRLYEQVRAGPCPCRWYRQSPLWVVVAFPGSVDRPTEVALRCYAMLCYAATKMIPWRVWAVQGGGGACSFMQIGKKPTTP